MQLLLDMTKPVNEFFYFFVVLTPEGAIYALDGEMHNKRFHIYFSCMENTALNVWNEMENRYIFHLLHLCFGDWGFSLNLWKFSMSLDDERIVQRTWVANKSEGDIMKENFTFAEFLLGNPKTTRFWMRTLVFEMFPHFSNTQTCLNKQTMSWCKDF